MSGQKCKTCGHPLSQHVGSDCRICYADGGPCVSNAAKDFSSLPSDATLLDAGDGSSYRFTRLAEAGAQAITSHPEYREGDKLIITIDRDDDTPGAMTGGIAAQGYGGPGDLFATLIEHARAVITSTGQGTVEMGQTGEHEFTVTLRMTPEDHGDRVKAGFAAAFLKGGS